MALSTRCPPAQPSAAGQAALGNIGWCRVASLHAPRGLRVFALDTRLPRPGAPEAARRHARALARAVASRRLAALLGCSPQQLALGDARGQPPRLHWLGPGAAPEGLDTLCVSISHAPGLSLLAWCPGRPVGVDLQTEPGQASAAELLRTAALYLGEEAHAALARQAPADRLGDLGEAFTRRWARHEARLKCLGLPLCEWTAALGATLAAVDAAPLELPAWAGSGVRAAVAWRGVGGEPGFTSNRQRPRHGRLDYPGRPSCRACCCSCNCRHITLPEPDLGSASTNSTICGTL